MNTSNTNSNKSNSSVSTTSSPNKKTKTSGWAIYSRSTGDMIYFATTRSMVRDHRASLSSPNDYTGAKRISIVATLD